MPLRSQTLRWGIIAPTFLSALFLIVYVTFTVVWPIHSVTEVEMKILTPVVTAGGEVKFSAHLCKHVTAPSEIHFGLRSDDGRYFDAGMEWGNNPPGCMDIIQHFHAPTDAPLGHYQVWVVAVLVVNSLRTDRFRIPMGEINIIAREGK